MSREPIPLAFYASLKSPNHPAPSGDRTMARLLIRALERAGFAPELASELRTFDKEGDPGRQERLRAASIEEAERLIEHYASLASSRRPRAWFTYHVYYKAPDWIGPRVADALRIPYLVAEGSRAPKRAEGPWALGHRGAEAALDRAEVVFVMTAKDRPALERQRPERQHLVELPPFIDLGDWALSSPAAEQGLPAGSTNSSPLVGESLPSGSDPKVSAELTGGGGAGGTGTDLSCTTPTPDPSPQGGGEKGVRLLTVAMMRAGDKLASYRLLAEALARLGDLPPWSLDVVGDGEALAEVEALLAPHAGRVRLLGQVEDRAALSGLYAAADLLVWPAVNEAYGMVFLEAQAHGCPVVAGDYGGVASVVRDGETGLLTPPGDVGALAGAVRALLADPLHRAAMGVAARRFVTEERHLGRAAERLRAGLLAVVPQGATA